MLQPMPYGLLTDSSSTQRVAMTSPGGWRRWHPEFSHFSPPALLDEIELAFGDLAIGPGPTRPARAA